MSNVFRRFHQPTGVEYWDNAMEIEIGLTRFLLNDKNVPKRYLYIYVVPTLNTLGRMWDWIVAAYTTYPTTPELLKKKQMSLHNALCGNEAVIQRIQRMIYVLPIDLNKLDGLGELLDKESALLRNALKNCKLQQQKKSDK